MRSWGATDGACWFPFVGNDSFGPSATNQTNELTWDVSVSVPKCAFVRILRY